MIETNKESVLARRYMGLGPLARINHADSIRLPAVAARSASGLA
jgi:hypothetical protein